MIQITDPRFFFGVASVHCGIECCNRRFDGGPFPLAILVLGCACLKAAFVGVGARISDILVAVCLGKEDAKTDTARDFGIGCVETLRSSDIGSQVDNIGEWGVRVLRIGWRRLHDGEESQILVDNWFIVGIKVGRRNSKFIWPANSRGQQVAKVFVVAHDVEASEIEGLSRPVRQLFMRIDLRAPFAQDELKTV
jgi:hypothetical protein